MHHLRNNVGAFSIKRPTQFRSSLSELAPRRSSANGIFFIAPLAAQPVSRRGRKSMCALTPKTAQSPKINQALLPQGISLFVQRLSDHRCKRSRLIRRAIHQLLSSRQFPHIRQQRPLFLKQFGRRKGVFLPSRLPNSRKNQNAANSRSGGQRPPCLQINWRHQRRGQDVIPFRQIEARVRKLRYR